jgi:hypothetical protein
LKLRVLMGDWMVDSGDQRAPRQGETFEAALEFWVLGASAGRFV